MVLFATKHKSFLLNKMTERKQLWKYMTDEEKVIWVILMWQAVSHL